MVYVEGVAFGPISRMPMLHAWNAFGLRRRTAIDWTFYAGSRWMRYIGIPLTVEENMKLRRLTPLGTSVHLIFHKKYFTPKAKARLIQILEQRKR